MQTYPANLQQKSRSRFLPRLIKTIAGIYLIKIFHLTASLESPKIPTETTPPPPIKTHEQTFPDTDMVQNSLSGNPLPPPRPTLGEQRQQIATDCTRCNRCVTECGFLARNGTPGQLAAGLQANDPAALRLAFDCSLCDLCTAVCPEHLSPAQFFLSMRRAAVALGSGHFPEHNRPRSYEQLGTSKRFTWYALPEHCDTVFFPGCALTGASGATTLKTFDHLRQVIPAIGIVLDCCSKPSHDLGDDAQFQARFGEMKNFLAEHGIRNLLVACPNCYKVFNDYAQEFRTRGVYEHLDSRLLPALTNPWPPLLLHDPCAARFLTDMQASVRKLADENNLPLTKPSYSGLNTLCCGAGGAVASLTPELAENWAHRLTAETSGERIASYCACCTRTLGKHSPTVHLLDLLFTPERALVDSARTSKAPMTYLNRLKVKRHLQRNFPAAVTRERTLAPEPVGKLRPRKQFSVPAWFAVIFAASMLFLAVAGQSLAWKLFLPSLFLLVTFGLLCYRLNQVRGALPARTASRKALKRHRAKGKHRTGEA